MGKWSTIFNLQRDSNLWMYSSSKACVKYQENFLTIGMVRYCIRRWLGYHHGKFRQLLLAWDQWLVYISFCVWHLYDLFLPSDIPWFLKQFTLCHIQIPAASSLFCWPYAFKHRAVCCAWQAGRLQRHPAGTERKYWEGEWRGKEQYITSVARWQCCKCHQHRACSSVPLNPADLELSVWAQCKVLCNFCIYCIMATAKVQWEFQRGRRCHEQMERQQ